MSGVIRSGIPASAAPDDDNAPRQRGITEEMIMNKQRKAYQIRTFAYEGAFSKAAGRKLYSRVRALRIVRFLKNRGVDAIAAPMMVQASSIIAA